MIPLLICTFCFYLFFSPDLKAQSTEQQVKDKQYTFSVQSIQPFRGNLRPEMQSPGYYSLRVTPDSLISNLPFFGRSFSPTIGTSESPLAFTSTNFEYKVTDRKKGGWDILIKPKDVGKVQQMALTVFPDGNASMQVISVSRDPMSFLGLLRMKN